KCDVSKKQDIDNVVSKTIEKYKRIDGVLNNAGINHSASFFDTTEEDWDRVMSVDLKGTFLMSQAVAREMVRIGDGGSIVNISSVTAQIALSDQVPYCSAKGGVNQLTRAMAVALGQNNIIVNSIGPGPIMTELMERVVANKEKDKELIRRMPLGRKGSPDEIAGVAVFLMTEDASFITGQCIYADGGRMIQSFPRYMEK
ncbi:MAG: SDR family NAD(P)-dependent oxidoreductase, partial [Peptostreptococcaceae bacterium]